MTTLKVYASDEMAASDKMFEILDLPEPKTGTLNLDSKNKGNLISVITTDIELLEVFYAHTISPILIAILTSLVMITFFCQYSLCAGIYAAIAYCLLGVAVPLINSKHGKDFGAEYREKFGELNSYTLDTLRGLEEVTEKEILENRNCKVATSFEQVDFSYDKNEILANFSQEFNRGKLTGILGPSGCGKSTILKLLMRFYDPQSGKIEIYGRDVKRVNISELRTV